MCGIVAVLARPSRRAAPPHGVVTAAVEEVHRALADGVPPTGGPSHDALEHRLDALVEALTRLADHLAGVPGLTTLVEADRGEALRDALRTLRVDVDEHLDDLVRSLTAIPTGRLERINAALVRARDRIWQIASDRVGAAERVLALAGRRRPGPAALAGLWATDAALSCLDRIEVRGRDSAGITVLVAAPAVCPTDLDGRADPLLRHRAVRACRTAGAAPTLAFTYKVAAEIGELGDNVRALRDAVRDDDLLHEALGGEDARVTVLGHTRWASVGVISEANAHPLDALAANAEPSPSDVHQVFAVLNGDVDNHHDLLAVAQLAPPPSITTDAKAIPLLTSRRLDAGDPAGEAFRATVATFEGSVAVGAVLPAAPDTVHLALRGSGQALYVGCTDDAYIVASEPYGVVELAGRALRMDGETPGNPAAPVASRGQIVTLQRDRAGEPDGIHRIAYDGTRLAVTAEEVREVGLTTRDIDRRGFPHYLLKEISEAPESFEKTLRGRIRDGADGRLHAFLDEAALPRAVRDDLASGRTTHVFVIGQGTAAVAGEAIARALRDALVPLRPTLSVEAMPATELSGFNLASDLGDTLVVAISQSGTTTDTNRTVDLVRQRGGKVLAIVNRRGSDLTDKADGVLYTSDGRDVEMSVASTKAFYAQVAAGFLLAAALTEAAATEPGASGGTAQDAPPPGSAAAVAAAAADDRLRALLRMPGAMRTVLDRRDRIAAAVEESDCTARRHWAIVGNGRNHVTARELRIKLSELCYKSIACDATEDKKHIDLSSEPMILVCAAGLTGSTADDVGKEVAIFAAHEAKPVVIHTEGADALAARASASIPVPSVHPEVDFLLGAVAGHLFGYEAARAIDRLAQPLRETRAVLEAHATPEADPEELLRALRPALAEHLLDWFVPLRRGRMDGCLEASTGLALASAFQTAIGVLDLRTFALLEGGQASSGSPAHVLESLAQSLSRAIDELTRPIDAIKHQAKTVTVGISRADEALLTVPLVRALFEAGHPRENLAFDDLRALAALDPLVASVDGSTRYAVGGVDEDGGSIRRLGSTGIAAGLASRTDRDPQLKGTKHLVAREKQLLVARGRADGRNVVLVPEISGAARGGDVVGITLLHVTLRETAGPGTVRAALSVYRARYAALRDLVTETEAAMDDALLGTIPTIELLTTPIYELAERWRGGADAAT